MSGAPLRVLVAGGGVAALEAALALRELAEERVSIELLAPEPHFWYRPLSVAEPFGGDRVRPIELADIANACGAGFTLGALSSVEPSAHVARTSSGAEFEYDALLLATGTRPVAAVPGAFLFRGLADTTAFEALLAELDSGSIRRLVFALPGGVSWPLPLYELALQTAGRGSVEAVELALVTPEERPLFLFGPEAGAAITSLLEARRVALHLGRYPVSFDGGTLALAPEGAIAADRVIALPQLHADPIPGIPHDAKGFVPTDLHGRVRGVAHVYAAGDLTTFPVKQGGLAAQQADAAADTIAAAAGANLTPKPFRPVLRGLLLTGDVPAYLRAELPHGRSAAGYEPLWWPPGKVVGRYLAPFLAERAGLILSPPAAADAVPVDVDLVAMSR
jgi:sulfide:quinone oxidoreductase